MNLSFIRKISHFARCGFFEKLVSPQVFCPDAVELLIKHSPTYRAPNNKDEIKLNTLSNQSFLYSIINIFEITLNENHEKQPMFCRVAIKIGLLELLIRIFKKQNDNCITHRLKNALLRTIIGLIRFSPTAASYTWVKLKNEISELIFSDDISMRIWGIKYISTIIKMVEADSEDCLALDFIQPLELCPSIFVLMYDECVPIRLQTIKILCRIIITQGSEKECKQLVYMGIIGLLLDVLKQNDLRNCTNSIAFPIIISLIRLIKISEKWCMIFIYSKGVEITLTYLKYSVEKIIIPVILLIFNACSYSSFHTNKVLECKTLDKLHRIKELINSEEFIKIIDQVIYSLIMKCTEYEILYSFIMNSGDPYIIEN
ncbi:Armadillo-type fold containing protein, partial [Cryptosporidium hominis]